MNSRRKVVVLTLRQHEKVLFESEFSEGLTTKIKVRLFYIYSFPSSCWKRVWRNIWYKKFPLFSQNFVQHKHKLVLTCSDLLRRAATACWPDFCLVWAWSKLWLLISILFCCLWNCKPCNFKPFFTRKHRNQRHFLKCKKCSLAFDLCEKSKTEESSKLVLE